MNLTRRHFLHTATLFGLVGTRVWAESTVEFDKFIVHSLSDGKLVLPMDFLLSSGTGSPDVQAILAEAGITGDTFDSPLNVTLVKRGDDVILFDAGSGPDFMSTAGRLPEALAAAGIGPDQVTHVVFTHAHPDHIWGVLDDFDEPLFPNARHMIGRIERDYWIDPATPDAIDETRLSFVAGASRRIELLGDRLETFDDGDEILPDIKAVMTPGHTPGHMSFDIGQKLLVAGDFIADSHLSFRHPEHLSQRDQDPEMAAETRIKMLNILEKSGMTIIGYHLPSGGIGHVQQAKGAFAFVSG